jgi:uncharacterized protein YegJ (DUF2314 family)
MNIFFASGESPKMIEAFKKAQDTFKFFWRELYWEYRRIIPALDLACVKVVFTQHVPGSEEPIVEHMWVNEVDFDGQNVSGNLINDPNEITDVNNGDHVKVSLSRISDWLFATEGKTYGGFTIQAMRSEMSKKELKEHDNAWGLDFGNFNEIFVVRDQNEKPENLIEHPMSKNMRESLIDFLKQNPNELISKDDFGHTFLHRETIAGNRTSIEVLKEAGVDITQKTGDGKTALDLARQLNWEHIIPLLTN